MDPVITLQAAEECFKDGEHKDCVDHLMDYFRWRINQGFEPANGDNRSYALLAKLACKIDCETIDH